MCWCALCLRTSIHLNWLPSVQQTHQSSSTAFSAIVFFQCTFCPVCSAFCHTENAHLPPVLGVQVTIIGTANATCDCNAFLKRAPKRTVVNSASYFRVASSRCQKNIYYHYPFTLHNLDLQICRFRLWFKIVAKRATCTWVSITLDGTPNVVWSCHNCRVVITLKLLFKKNQEMVLSRWIGHGTKKWWSGGV